VGPGSRGPGRLRFFYATALHCHISVAVPLALWGKGGNGGPQFFAASAPALGRKGAGPRPPVPTRRAVYRGRARIGGPLPFPGRTRAKHFFFAGNPARSDREGRAFPWGEIPPGGPGWPLFGKARLRFVVTDGLFRPRWMGPAHDGGPSFPGGPEAPFALKTGGAAKTGRGGAGTTQGFGGLGKLPAEFTSERGSCSWRWGESGRRFPGFGPTRPSGGPTLAPSRGPSGGGRHGRRQRKARAGPGGGDTGPPPLAPGDGGPTLRGGEGPPARRWDRACGLATFRVGGYPSGVGGCVENEGGCPPFPGRRAHNRGGANGLGRPYRDQEKVGGIQTFRNVGRGGRIPPSAGGPNGATVPPSPGPA
jgi:hypothetical protein